MDFKFLDTLYITAKGKAHRNVCGKPVFNQAGFRADSENISLRATIFIVIINFDEFIACPYVKPVRNALGNLKAIMVLDMTGFIVPGHGSRGEMRRSFKVAFSREPGTLQVGENRCARPGGNDKNKRLPF